MARLNESAAPVESIDTLKRRFVRQNREIARVNSIQSLRIRSLESEVSRLLSENVSLREQVITLGQELGRFGAAKSLNDGIYSIRAKLDGKLAELNKLVAELGALPRVFNKIPAEGTEHATHNTLDPASTESGWQSTGFDSSIPVDANGRLPVILEDKYYPRRTMESQELEELVRNASPHEDHVDDQNMCSSLSAEPFDDPPQGAGTHLDATIVPTTLETGKDNAPNAVLTSQPSLHSEVIATKINAGISRKTGAKRKFSSDDSGEYVPSPREDDDFQFTRPKYASQKAQEQPITYLSGKSPINGSTGFKGQSKCHSQPKRKALEPKNVNSGIESPMNPRGAKYSQHKKNTLTVVDADDRETVQLLSSRATQACSLNITGLNEDSSCNDVKQGHGDGSCIMSEHKILEEEPTQTPQSGTNHAHNPCESSTSNSNPTSRSTRRQRAVVSYAEPNLRDKMRRPTNEFIAAVDSGQARRSSTSQCCKAISIEELEHRGSSKVKGRKSQGLHPMGKGCESPGLNPPQEPKQIMGMVSQRRRKISATSNEEPLEILFDQSTEALEQQMLPQRSGDLGEDARQNPEDHSSHESDRMQVNLFRTIPTASSRQSRRHSSHPEASLSNLDFSCTETRHALTEACSSAVSHPCEEPLQLMADSECSELMPSIGQTHTVSLRADARRGQRAAARRRSMML